MLAILPWLIIVDSNATTGWPLAKADCTDFEILKRGERALLLRKRFFAACLKDTGIIENRIIPIISSNPKVCLTGTWELTCIYQRARDSTRDRCLSGQFARAIVKRWLVLLFIFTVRTSFHPRLSKVALIYWTFHCPFQFENSLLFAIALISSTFVRIASVAATHNSNSFCSAYTEAWNGTVLFGLWVNMPDLAKKLTCSRNARCMS